MKYLLILLAVAQIILVIAQAPPVFPPQFSLDFS